MDSLPDGAVAMERERGFAGNALHRVESVHLGVASSSPATSPKREITAKIEENPKTGMTVENSNREESPKREITAENPKREEVIVESPTAENPKRGGVVIESPKRVSNHTGSAVSINATSLSAPDQKVNVTDKLSDTNSGLKFVLPWSDGYSAEHLESSEWFQQLLDHTHNFDRREPVITVCADKTYMEGLFNWLISALVLQGKPPRNILVVTNRQKVCALLQTRVIPVKCLKVGASSLLNATGMGQVKGHQFSQLLVVRLSVMRILNRLGYDVLNLDSDAIMLKNPIPALEWNGDSDVVGTFGGHLPARLYRRWGLVVCMGAVMIRSVPATGKGEGREGKRGVW